MYRALWASAYGQLNDAMLQLATAVASLSAACSAYPEDYLPAPETAFVVRYDGAAESEGVAYGWQDVG